MLTQPTVRKPPRLRDSAFQILAIGGSLNIQTRRRGDAEGLKGSCMAARVGTSSTATTIEGLLRTGPRRVGWFEHR